MVGQRQVDQAALFYEFSLEPHVPAIQALSTESISFSSRASACGCSPGTATTGPTDIPSLSKPPYTSGPDPLCWMAKPSCLASTEFSDFDGLVFTPAR
jgi:hypothetical protein